MILPSWLTSNPYVHDLFFPPFAEIQHPWGSPSVFLRPSAPFPYANSWGVAILILTPVAVAAFILARTWIDPPRAPRRRRRDGPAGHGVIEPRHVRRAGPVRDVHRRSPGGAGPGGPGARARGQWACPQCCSWCPGACSTSIATRQQYGQSTDSRFSLYAETFRRTLESPLLGYGAPRPSYGAGALGRHPGLRLDPDVQLTGSSASPSSCCSSGGPRCARGGRRATSSSSCTAVSGRHQRRRRSSTGSTSCRCWRSCWWPRSCCGAGTGWTRMPIPDRGLPWLGGAAALNLAAGAVGALRWAW